MAELDATMSGVGEWTLLASDKNTRRQRPERRNGGRGSVNSLDWWLSNETG